MNCQKCGERVTMFYMDQDTKRVIGNCHPGGKICYLDSGDTMNKIISYDFSNKREDHMISDCSCGEEHEIIHKIYWSDGAGLVCVNFWVCTKSYETHFLDDENQELYTVSKKVRGQSVALSEEEILTSSRNYNVFRD